MGLKINPGLLKPRRVCCTQCSSVPLKVMSPLISVGDRSNVYKSSGESRVWLRVCVCVCVGLGKGVNKPFQWLLPVLTARFQAAHRARDIYWDYLRVQLHQLYLFV